MSSAPDRAVALLFGDDDLKRRRNAAQPVPQQVVNIHMDHHDDAQHHDHLPLDGGNGNANGNINGNERERKGSQQQHQPHQQQRRMSSPVIVVDDEGGEEGAPPPLMIAYPAFAFLLRLLGLYIPRYAWRCTWWLYPLILAATFGLAATFFADVSRSQVKSLNVPTWIVPIGIISYSIIVLVSLVALRRYFVKNDIDVVYTTIVEHDRLMERARIAMIAARRGTPPPLPTRYFRRTIVNGIIIVTTLFISMLSPISAFIQLHNTDDTWLLGPTPHHFSLPYHLWALILVGWPSYIFICAMTSVFAIFAMVCLLHADLANVYREWLQCHMIRPEHHRSPMSNLVIPREQSHAWLLGRRQVRGSQALHSALLSHWRFSVALASFESSFSLVLLPSIVLVVSWIGYALALPPDIITDPRPLLSFLSTSLGFMFFLLWPPALISQQCDECILVANLWEVSATVVITSSQCF
jgi:hypothetical protein